MTLQARPYQKAAVDGVLMAWFGREEPQHNVLGVAPTGAGKTVMFNMIIAEVLRRRPAARILVMAHRKELLEQGQAKFQTFIGGDVTTGIVQAERNECMAQIVFASKDTIRQPKRLAALLGWGRIDVLITDEAHHAEADTYRQITEELRAVNPDLLHLGVTATPNRGDGKGLGGVYQHIAFRYGLKDLIPAYLVPPRWLGIKTGISLKGVKVSKDDYVLTQLADAFETPYCLDLVVKSHQKYAHDGRHAAAGRPFVAFTISVAGAHALAEKFQEAGYNVLAIDGTMDAAQRRDILGAFDRGELHGLTNCAVLTEGWDAPRIECVHMVRPTKSDALYLQCIGRGLRPINGHQPQAGEDCLILEYAPANTRNLTNFGRVLDVPEREQRKLEKADEALIEEGLDATLEDGDVLAALTWDGQMEMGVGAEGLEVHARELRYLDASPFTWQRSEGWLLLSLGEGRDGIKRILAVSPEVEGVKTLYALWARPKNTYDVNNRMQFHPWQAEPMRPDTDHEALMEYANEVAERRGSPVLIDKKKAPRWMKQPASDAQRNMVKRMFPDEAKRQDLTKGEAGELITLITAKQVLERAGYWSAPASAPIPTEAPPLDAIPLAAISACKSCGAPIVWGRTENDKPCPYNVADGKATRESHFATCPQARSWSKKNATEEPA